MKRKYYLSGNFMAWSEMKIIRHLILALAIVSLPLEGMAKGPEIHGDLKARMGLSVAGDSYGLTADYFRLALRADLGEGFGCTVRQRLNALPSVADFLSATDYLNLHWTGDNWQFLVGKTYLACGGFDYSSIAYDLYAMPEFYNNLGGMFNYAVQATRFFGEEALCIQGGNSIYSTGFSNLLGCGVLLSGRQGPWEHTWSVNVYEMEKGHGNFFVCLGNRFHILENCTLDLGLDHRMDMQAPSFMKDFAVITRLKCGVTSQLDLLAKAIWDYKEEGIVDPLLPDGTNIWQAGGGVEYYPMKESRAVRLHCMFFHNSARGNNFFAGVSFSLGK